jgi:hypothetical protein
MEYMDASCDDTNDSQTVLSEHSLASLIGAANVRKLTAFFGGQGFNEIKLRRSSARGKCINFHRDISRRTMQVSLNSDDDYVGGRILYATDDGFLSPPKPAGSVTIHDHHIVHGVTRLDSGVRYGLFLLDMPLSNASSFGGHECPGTNIYNGMQTLFTETDNQRSFLDAVYSTYEVKTSGISSVYTV